MPRRSTRANVRSSSQTSSSVEESPIRATRTRSSSRGQTKASPSKSTESSPSPSLRSRRGQQKELLSSGDAKVVLQRIEKTTPKRGRGKKPVEDEPVSDEDESDEIVTPTRRARGKRQKEETYEEGRGDEKSTPTTKRGRSKRATPKKTPSPRKSTPRQGGRRKKTEEEVEESPAEEEEEAPEAPRKVEELTSPRGGRPSRRSAASAKKAISGASPSSKRPSRGRAAKVGSTEQTEDVVEGEPNKEPSEKAEEEEEHIEIPEEEKEAVEISDEEEEEGEKANKEVVDVEAEEPTVSSKAEQKLQTETDSLKLQEESKEEQITSQKEEDSAIKAEVEQTDVTQKSASEHKSDAEAAESADVASQEEMQKNIVDENVVDQADTDVAEQQFGEKEKSSVPEPKVSSVLEQETVSDDEVMEVEAPDAVKPGAESEVKTRKEKDEEVAKPEQLEEKAHDEKTEEVSEDVDAQRAEKQDVDMETDVHRLEDDWELITREEIDEVKADAEAEETRRSQTAAPTANDVVSSEKEVDDEAVSPRKRAVADTDFEDHQQQKKQRVDDVGEETERERETDNRESFQEEMAVSENQTDAIEQQHSTEINGTESTAVKTASSDDTYKREFVFNKFFPSASIVSAEKKLSALSFDVNCGDGEFDALKVLKDLESLNSDIICLQELNVVASSRGKLDSALRSMHYTGSYYMDSQFKDGGLAVFFKTSELEQVQAQSLPMHSILQEGLNSSGLEGETWQAVQKFLSQPSSSVVQFVKLKSLKSGACVTVANVHMDQSRMKLPNLQTLQIACTVNSLVRFAGSNSAPMILCGNFAVKSDSPGYQLLRDGYLNTEMIEKLQTAPDIIIGGEEKKSLINLMWGCFKHTATSLKNAYVTTLGTDPDTKDYIWVTSSGLNIHGVLNLPPVPQQSAQHDHWSLKADLSFV